MSFRSPGGDGAVSLTRAQSQQHRSTSNTRKYNNIYDPLNEGAPPQLTINMGYRSLSNSLPRAIPSPGVGMSPDQWCHSFDSAPCFPNAYSNMQSSPCREPSLVSGVSGRDQMYPGTPSSQIDFAFEQQLPGNGPAVMSRGPSLQSPGYMADEPLYSQCLSSPHDWDQKQDLFGMGMGLTQLDTSATMFGSQDLGSVAMSRSISGISTSSVKSSASNRERREQDFKERMRKAEKQKIAPRPSAKSSDTVTSSRRNSKSSSMAVNDKGKYQRPSHPKVVCLECPDQPSFRGDHELRRHVAAKHEGIVKRFVCRDPRTAGVKSDLSPVHPISKCKSCINGKQYGAYYNAAAHLRRVHFSPKVPRGRNKGGKGQAERRGGKAGGDWPEIKDLKAWYTEVHCHQDDPAFSETAEFNDGVGGMDPTGTALGGELFASSFGIDPAYTTADAYDGMLSGDALEPWNMVPQDFGTMFHGSMASPPSTDLSMAPVSSLQPTGQFSLEDNSFLEMPL